MAFDFDAIVCGAGAAGLMAATRAAERGKRVALLEKGKRPGVKILMSGGTRCNVTHACHNRGIVEAFGPNGRFLHGPLAHFGVRDTVAFFEAEGVQTKQEQTGKIFPVSDRAQDVLAALLNRLGRTSAKLMTQSPLTDLEANPGGGFTLATPAGPLTAEKVVLTTGGLSYPGSGTTGDGYRFAARFGHEIVRTRPSLVPVTVRAAWPKQLQGITLSDVALKVADDTQSLAARRGSLLFAHFGLSGPVAMDVSRAISGHAQPTQLSLELDFLPAVPEAELADWLRRETQSRGKQLLAVVLSDKLPRRVCDQLLVVCGLAADRTSAALSKVDGRKLVEAVKRCRLPVQGTLGYEKAEVTAGGVALNEVDSRTMQSKLRPGLYLAGEVLDLDGWIGGYNFQSAWSTGQLAGASV